ncbi:MAG TPA: DUF397 domain-containing protein [Pseudonocardiaceae bacterium]|nr:DUF397 domain-containing protein [Pseudonocardiaceae bacterium]
MISQSNGRSWRKSSYTNPDSANCVEVALSVAEAGLRDSKDPHGPIITLPAPAFGTFRTCLREW